MILARKGDNEAAVELARQGDDLARQTDALNSRAAALLALAEVLTLALNPIQAIPIMKDALALYERKGDLVMAARTRERLGPLEQAMAAP